MSCSSTGIKAPAENRQISDMLKLQLNADGFFLEAHMKLRPVDFATEGIFLCGLAHSPKLIDENISQARAAASRAATVLSKTHLEVGAQVSEVNQDKCISCMTCVHACPYGAPFVNMDGKGRSRRPNAWAAASALRNVRRGPYSSIISSRSSSTSCWMICWRTLHHGCISRTVMNESCRYR